MSKKIAIIGAGGVIFSKKLMNDILLFPELSDCELSLMDIDAGRLENGRVIAEKLISDLSCGAKVSATTDLAKAITGADFVMTVFRTGTIDDQRTEYEIPMKYGVNQVVSDTLGVGGIFRGLRVLSPLMEVARTMEKVCPDAWLLNYVNPMSINTWAINKGTKIKNVGLCHSVQGTASRIAEYLGVDKDSLDFFVAGVNHQSFFLKLEKDGKNMYPELFEAMKNPEHYNRDRVRFEMMKHFGYFVTESSGHNSEYNQYFRKREDLIQKFCMADKKRLEDAAGKPVDIGGLRMGAGESGAAIDMCLALQARAEEELPKLLSGELSASKERSVEYGSQIINSVTTGDRQLLNLNIMNNGCIENLPYESCVEVPCVVDATGVHPCKVGKVPAQLAGLNNAMITVQGLVADGFLEGDREKIFWAAAHDPLASAVCSLDEIRSMVDELFDALRGKVSEAFYK